jgi:hypothetical protein
MNKQHISQSDLKIIQKKLWKSTGEMIPRYVLSFVMRKKGFRIERE